MTDLELANRMSCLHEERLVSLELARVIPGTLFLQAGQFVLQAIDVSGIFLCHGRRYRERRRKGVARADRHAHCRQLQRQRGLDALREVLGKKLLLPDT